MIRKILVFPLRVLRIILIIGGAFIFVAVGLLDLIIRDNLMQNKESIGPIRYSRKGKVLDINDFRADKTRGEL